MFARLKAAWARLATGSGSNEPPDVAPVEYKGYRIRPTPYATNGQFQTAGVIERQAPDGVKEHRFIGAERHQTRDDAIAFTISKAKQIIDMQGDRIFASKDA